MGQGLRLKSNWRIGVVLAGMLVFGCTVKAQTADDYGAQQANSRFASNGEGISAQSFNYLALYDAPGPSGVPLGGIGVGAVDLAPDGHFTRLAINNWATDSGVARARSENPEWDAEAFLAVWEKDSSGNVAAVRLERDRQSIQGMCAYKHTTYRGLFPTARIAFDDPVANSLHSLISVFAYSGLVPQDVKDSSLPGFWIEVTLANSDSKPVEAAVALSWPDLIGRGIYDVAQGAEKTGYDGAFDISKLVPVPSPSTQVEALQVENFQGLRQFSPAASPIRQATFQNYINAMAIIARVPDGGSVSTSPSWNTAEATDPWKSFREEGSFRSQTGIVALTQSGTTSSASVVAIKAHIAGGGKQTFRFLVTWSIPSPANASVRFGTSDYGRYFQNYFPDFRSLIRYEIAERARILEDTSAWHKPILESTLPDWLKFKLINSAYTMYTNTILNKSGDFSAMEGGMGGLSGTMDQRLVAHPFYQKFFTQLDRAELQRFADTQDTDGGILHFDGSYFVGLADNQGHTPIPHEKMIDNTGAWVIQLAKDYQQTGDPTFIRNNAEHIRRGFAYMKAQIRDNSFIPVGGQTYDDFPHPDISVYTGTVYLAALRAGVVLDNALGDVQLAQESEAQFRQTQEGLIRALWNGRFFAYGTDVGGGHRRDDRLFSGQLAGEFLSRYAGWGDVLPIQEAKSSVDEQLRTSVIGTPDFYAPKVWDIEMQRGVDMPGSRSWPFYLESYTAMTGIQLGFVADGLDIMRHIQLVHLRRGWTWSQNLWNPAELTYVAAPVTWFATDVLSNASLDLAERRITLGPTLLPGQKRTVLPLFFPCFWSTLEYAPDEHKVLLHIIKTFDTKPIVLDTLVVEPIGTPASNSKTFHIAPVTLKAGETIDLSEYLPAFEKVEIQETILAPQS
jgi:uncharacterized protein (DUF608 family)